jgi:hypothetical protein
VAVIHPASARGDERTTIAAIFMKELILGFSPFEFIERWERCRPGLNAV